VSPNTDRTVSPPAGSVEAMDNTCDNNTSDNNDVRMTVWCRMWSEDPALAHELMTDTCVQWSGQTAGLDAVTGPSEQERFVTSYRAQHVNVFAPRALVDAGRQFAYLWDVTRPDGSILTGADVNVLRGDRIDQNWTFVSDRHDDRPDPAPQPASEATLHDLARRWIAPAEGEHAANIVSADFDVFATGLEPDGGRGPAALSRYLGWRRAGAGSTAVTLHREPVVDAGRGRIALLRTDRAGADASGGVDVLAVQDGRIAKAWSLSGTRPFRY
jgi:hypothetical protein